MKKTLRNRFGLLAVGFSFVMVGQVQAANYYVHPALGNDSNVGLDVKAPIRTLARASRLALHPGDQVLLAAGQKFEGQLAFNKLAGTAADPIIVSSYRDGQGEGGGQPVIDARGYVAGICLKNCAHFVIANLTITANAGGMHPDQPVKPEFRCGILVFADALGPFAGFTLTNLTVRDVFYEAPGFVRSSDEVKSANGTQCYGYGIRFMANEAAAILTNIVINDCLIENVEHTGLKLTAADKGLQQIEVQRVRISQTGGPGVQMSGVQGGHFSYLEVNGSGSKDDSRKWGRGSGLWTWGTSDVIIEKSRFENANGPGDSCGVHIDYNCRNIVVQHNLSVNNAGGFCEILGNNYNCAYRYNVSINDGHRVKGKDGAFQEGKIFWLSGYTGQKSPHCGPFNTYFYNNTIYVRDGIVAKVAVTSTARGILIANNIFCIEGESQAVAGDQQKAEGVRTQERVQNAVFLNNLFLRSDSWPKNSIIQDASPIYGDPQFAKAGGDKLVDYIPANHALIRQRGIDIHKLFGDESGLSSGLRVPTDILGQSILGRPGLGAIEVPPTVIKFQESPTIKTGEKMELNPAVNLESHVSK